MGCPSFEAQASSLAPIKTDGHLKGPWPCTVHYCCGVGDHRRCYLSASLYLARQECRSVVPNGRPSQLASVFAPRGRAGYLGHLD